MENRKKDENGSYRSRTVQLTKSAKQRLRWIEHYAKHRNARLTCRHFGISPDTFYLWKKRFDSSNLLSLEDNKSNRRPKSVRSPKYTKADVDTIKKLKEINPRVGKIAITKTLAKKGIKISSSTVGRILKLTESKKIIDLQS